MLEQKEFVALMSLDWADRAHEGCLQVVGSEEIEKFKLQQKASVIAEWVGILRSRFKGGKIAVAVEQKRGPLIYALMKYELFVIFPLNTTAAKNYRKALRASGAKDDPSDAFIQLLFLRNHIGQLRRLEPDGALTRQLRILVEARRKTVDQSTRLSNQITALLKEYYPIGLDVVGNLKTLLACDLLDKWPSLQAIQKAGLEKVRQFYYKGNCRHKETIEQRLRLICEAVPLIDEKPIVAAYVLTLRPLLHQLRLMLKEVKKLDRAIEKNFRLHPDKSLYKSLPSAGDALEPRLAVVFGDDRNRFDSALAVSNLTGVSPVTVRSGKMKTVLFRLGAPKFARQSLIEFAGQTIRKSVWASLYYQKCRSEGKSHNAAIRVVAYKWIRILYRCWKNRVTYDETVYLAALSRRKVPWLKPTKLS